MTKVTFLSNISNHFKSLVLSCIINNKIEFDINFLLFSALRNIAFAPFALVVERWRWNAFSGKTKPHEYNLEWWRLRYDTLN